jgi:hypothetical protein
MSKTELDELAEWVMWSYSRRSDVVEQDYGIQHENRQAERLRTECPRLSAWAYYTHDSRYKAGHKL